MRFMITSRLAFYADAPWSRLPGMKTAAGIALLGAVTLGRLNAAAPLPIACESLAQTKVTNGRVLSAESVRAGAFTPPNAANANAAAAFITVPAFCRVTLQLTPSSDSDIRVEVWLPKVGWNHKLQASGNGGLGGAIPYPALAASVKAGYAAVGTDTGHAGGNADFVAGHPEKLVDFGYRAIHEMTITAKTVVTAHYDARPVRAYFSSCSTGGRQALIEAQRYPDDFDGIVAGDPSWDQMRLYAARVWLNTYVNRTPAAVIPTSTAMPRSRSWATILSRSRTRKLIIHWNRRSPKYDVSSLNGAKTVVPALVRHGRVS
jgi:feruloyl esterase